MISYQCDHQAQVVRVRQTLNARGIKLWSVDEILA
eukprot:SAG31_NODE_37077_length_307_cov_1.177885_2_plen_34_part_01